MTGFDKREEGFEREFVHDEELKFKATARRNKLVGLWAAGKLSLTGADVEAYAKSRHQQSQDQQSTEHPGGTRHHH